MHTQQLYYEYKQSKHAHQPQLRTLRRKNMLQIIVELPDNHTVTLENSIPLLTQLGLVEEIKSVEHIVGLMESKKGEGIGWEAEGKQLWQCRLIYFLWHIIANEQIQMRDFKELIILLSSEQKNRVQQIQSIYGQKEEIGELVQTLDKLLGQSSRNTSSPQLNDISIIKTKNQGHFGSNKENVSSLSSTYNSTVNRSFDPKSSRQAKSKSKLQKSYSKKSAKTLLGRSNSSGRINTKRSEACSVVNSNIPLEQINFFSDSEALTSDDEKKLIDRLYDFSKYRTRQQLKQEIDQQRRRLELNGCTFKPQINKTVASFKEHREPAKEIKGFERAIGRIKQGYQKTKQLKQNLQFRSSKEFAPLANQLTQCIPPKFHSKPIKQQKTELFELKFSLGRMSIPIKVRQSDSLEQLVERIGRIYSLKQHQKDFIKQSIFSCLDQYKQIILESKEVKGI